MKLNKFAYLYLKALGNHTLKIMKKIPGNLLLKNLEKSWKYHRILSVRKSGNPAYLQWLIFIHGSRFRFTPQTNGYIVLCRTCHTARSQIQIPNPIAEYRDAFGIWISECK